MLNLMDGSQMTKKISHHDALIYTMVIMSASDRSMTDSELRRIGDIVKSLPVFTDFDPGRIIQVATECGELLQSENGLKDTMDIIAHALPKELHDTAYSLAVDVAAADLHLGWEELRVLQVLGESLELDKLTTAAIERAAVARFRKL